MAAATRVKVSGPNKRAMHAIRNTPVASRPISSRRGWIRALPTMAASAGRVHHTAKDDRRDRCTDRPEGMPLHHAEGHET